MHGHRSGGARARRRSPSPPTPPPASPSVGLAWSTARPARPRSSPSIPPPVFPNHAAAGGVRVSAPPFERAAGYRAPRIRPTQPAAASRRPGLPPPAARNGADSRSHANCKVHVPSGVCLHLHCGAGVGGRVRNGGRESDRTRSREFSRPRRLCIPLGPVFPLKVTPPKPKEQCRLPSPLHTLHRRRCRQP